MKIDNRTVSDIEEKIERLAKSYVPNGTSTGRIPI